MSALCLLLVHMINAQAAIPVDTFSVNIGPPPSHYALKIKGAARRSPNRTHRTRHCTHTY